ncbi:hypothetical protein NPIL_419071, partial [Nephila pilipes]
EYCTTSMECHNEEGYCCKPPGWPYKANRCLPFLSTSSCVGPLSEDFKTAPLRPPMLG